MADTLSGRKWQHQKLTTKRGKYLADYYSLYCVLQSNISFPYSLNCELYLKMATLICNTKAYETSCIFEFVVLQIKYSNFCFVYVLQVQMQRDHVILLVNATLEILRAHGTGASWAENATYGAKTHTPDSRYRCFIFLQSITCGLYLVPKISEI